MAKKKITKIVFGTSSQGKFEEVQRIMSLHGIALVKIDDLGDFPEAPESSDSFLGNANEKAEFYSKLVDLPVLAEDTGIEIDALNGEPGIYTKRYPIMHGKPEMEPRDYILERMAGISNRQCRMHSAMALYLHGQRICFAEGICDGRLANKARGSLTKIGIDAIFIADRCKLTFAEQGVDGKNMRSHRSIAARNIVAQIIELFGKPY